MGLPPIDTRPKIDLSSLPILEIPNLKKAPEKEPSQREGIDLSALGLNEKPAKAEGIDLSSLGDYFKQATIPEGPEYKEMPPVEQGDESFGATLDRMLAQTTTAIPTAVRGGAELLRKGVIDPLIAPIEGLSPEHGKSLRQTLSQPLLDLEQLAKEKQAGAEELFAKTVKPASSKPITYKSLKDAPAETLRRALNRAIESAPTSLGQVALTYAVPVLGFGLNAAIETGSTAAAIDALEAEGIKVNPEYKKTINTAAGITKAIPDFFSDRLLISILKNRTGFLFKLASVALESAVEGKTERFQELIDIAAEQGATLTPEEVKNFGKYINNTFNLAKVNPGAAASYLGINAPRRLLGKTPAEQALNIMRSEEADIVGTVAGGLYAAPGLLNTGRKRVRGEQLTQEQIAQLPEGTRRALTSGEQPAPKIDLSALGLPSGEPRGLLPEGSASRPAEPREFIAGPSESDIVTALRSKPNLIPPDIDAAVLDRMDVLEQAGATKEQMDSDAVLKELDQLSKEVYSGKVAPPKSVVRQRMSAEPTIGAGRQVTTQERVIPKRQLEAEQQPVEQPVEAAAPEPEKAPVAQKPEKAPTVRKPAMPGQEGTATSANFKEAVKIAKESFTQTKGKPSAEQFKEAAAALKAANVHPVIIDEITNPERFSRPGEPGEKSDATTRRGRYERAVPPPKNLKSGLNQITDTASDFNKAKADYEAAKTDLLGILKQRGVEIITADDGVTPKDIRILKGKTNLSPAAQRVIKDAIQEAAQKGGFSAETVGQGFQMSVTPVKAFPGERLQGGTFAEQLKDFLKKHNAVKAAEATFEQAKNASFDALVDDYLAKRVEGKEGSAYRGEGKDNQAEILVRRKLSASDPDVEPYRTQVKALRSKLTKEETQRGADYLKVTKTSGASRVRIAKGKQERVTVPKEPAVMREEQTSYSTKDQDAQFKKQPPYEPNYKKRPDASEKTDKWAKDIVDGLEKGRKQGRVILANAINTQFRNESTADLVGQEIRTSDDVAVLAQVYRKPTIEAMRYVLVKDGKVVHETGVTSRLPSSTAIFPYAETAEGLAWLNELIKSTGADSYYIVHNHPSGNATASPDDVKQTITIAKGAPGFKGHVIVDSNEYTVIDESFRPAKQVRNFGEDALLTPSLDHPVLGTKVDSNEAIADIVKRLQTPKGWATLIGTSKSKVRSIMAVEEGQLADPKKAAAIARRFATQTGSANIYVHTSDQFWNDNLTTLTKGIKEGFIIDAVSEKGNSANEWLAERTSVFGKERVVKQFGKEEPVGKVVGESKAVTTETIKVDGKERPTRNSNGKLIHPTLQGIENFWKWFGDSKVTDDQGRPLVVYHGTTADFTTFKKDKSKKTDRSITRLFGFFFTDKKSEADRYANWNMADGKIIHSYLSIKNFYTMLYPEFDNMAMYEFNKMKEANFNFSDSDALQWNKEAKEEIETRIKTIKQKGYDGIFVEKLNEYIAFEPTQIKSATGNIGTFSPTEPSIVREDQPLQEPNDYIDLLSTGGLYYDAGYRNYDAWLEKMKSSYGEIATPAFVAGMPKIWNAVESTLSDRFKGKQFKRREPAIIIDRSDKHAVAMSPKLTEAITYIAYNYPHLFRNVDSILFEKFVQSDSKRNTPRASFSVKNNQVKINTALINENTPTSDIIESLIHEFAHSRQQRGMEPKNYFSPTRSPLDKLKYMAQPEEVFASRIGLAAKKKYEKPNISSKLFDHLTPEERAELEASFKESEEAFKNVQARLDFGLFDPKLRKNFILASKAVLKALSRAAKSNFVKFGDWSKEMVKLYGQKIGDYLVPLWNTITPTSLNVGDEIFVNGKPIRIKSKLNHHGSNAANNTQGRTPSHAKRIRDTIFEVVADDYADRVKGLNTDLANRMRKIADAYKLFDGKIRHAVNLTDLEKRIRDARFNWTKNFLQGDSPTANLEKVYFDEHGNGYTALTQIITDPNGNVPNNLTELEKDIVKTYKKILEIAKTLHKRFSLVDSELEDIPNKPRIALTYEAKDAVYTTKEASPLYHAIVNGLAKANRTQDVKSFKLKAEDLIARRVDGNWEMRSVTDREWQEVNDSQAITRLERAWVRNVLETRGIGLFETFPNYVMLDNRAVPITANNVFDALSALSAETAKISALAREFGPHYRQYLTKEQELLADKGLNTKPITDWLDAYFNRRPVPERFIQSRGSAAGSIKRFSRLVDTTIKTAALSASAPLQFPSVLMGLHLTGYKAFFKGAADTFRAVVNRKGLAELAAMGAVHREVYNFSIKKGEIFEDLANAVRQTGGRVSFLQQANKIQSYFSAFGMQAFADQIIRNGGKMTKDELATLVSLDFGAEDIKKIRSGEMKKGDSLYSAIVGRSVRYLTGEGLTGGENSRFLRSPMAQLLLPFSRWPVLQMKRFSKEYQIGKKLLRQGDYKTWINRTAKLVGGAALAGELQFLIGAMLFGTTLKDAWERPDENMIERFFNDLLAGAILGPFSRLAWIALQSEQTAERIAASATFWGNIAYDVVNMLTDSHEFANQTWWEKGERLLRKRLPAMKYAEGFRQNLAVLGLGKANDLEYRALKNLRRKWLEENDLGTSYDRRGYQESTVQFRKIYERLVEGEQDINEILGQVLKVKEQELLDKAIKEGREVRGIDEQDAIRSLKASLKFRKFFAIDGKDMSEAQLAGLKAFMGESRYEQMAAHDKLLDELIDSLSTASRVRRRR